MDIDYGALFGIDEGGKEQEIADPATDETTQAQGAEEQEAADPAEEQKFVARGELFRRKAAVENGYAHYAAAVGDFCLVKSQTFTDKILAHG